MSTQISTRMSKNLKEASMRSVSLYRRALRALPGFIYQYNLPADLPTMRSRIRSDFQGNIEVSDPKVIDRLVYVGEVELQEALEFWKQRSHVLNYFFEVQKPKKSSSKFLDAFYAGDD